MAETAVDTSLPEATAAVAVNDHVDMLVVVDYHWVPRGSVRIVTVHRRRWLNKAVARAKMFVVQDGVLRHRALLSIKRQRRGVQGLGCPAVMVVACGVAHAVRVANVVLQMILAMLEQGRVKHLFLIDLSVGEFAQ